VSAEILVKNLSLAHHSSTCRTSPAIARTPSTAGKDIDQEASAEMSLSRNWQRGKSKSGI